MASKVKIFSWGLYDFANSIIVANLTLYFSQWLVVDNHLPDLWYSIFIALSTIFLIVTSPLAGEYLDKTHRRMRFITWCSLIMGLTMIGLGIFGASGHLLTAAIFAFVATYVGQLSIIGYDMLLPTLTSKLHFGKISGLGKAMDDLGFIIGMAVTLPLVNKAMTLWGTPGRVQAFAPAGIIFLLLALPMLLLIKDDPIKLKTPLANFSRILADLKVVLKNKNILLFLLFFYFFSDALLTALAFFPIYFNQVFGISDTQKVMLTGTLLVGTVIGAATWGKVSDVISKKLSLMVCSVALTVFFLSIPLTSGRTIWFIAPIAGLFWGGYYSISRAFLTLLSPPDQLGRFLSLFTIFRRFASVVGPLIWGLSVSLFAFMGPVNKYRISIYPLALMMVVGLFLLRRVKDVATTSDRTN